mmetsp:Transcript_15783/g.24556  ORF Transcript_15783/g.24556 Transcript_15783/m.24556 type:complete len:271 (+) Transcript_15783:385-1197(+)
MPEEAAQALQGLSVSGNSDIRQPDISSNSTAAQNGNSSASHRPLVCRLVDSCRKHFTGPGRLTTEGIDEVGKLMNQMQATDVGLIMKDENLTNIEFVDVIDNDDFTVGIFLIPKGQRLPLHDHPGMTVLSKVLFGTLKVNSFDKAEYSRPIEEKDFNEPFPCVVRNASELVTVHGKCKILHPTSGGNLHEFIAHTDCGVLDVLAPPYDFDGGRPCNYFSIVKPDVTQAGAATPEEEDACLENGTTVKMVAIPAPPDFYTLRRQYTGPALE